MSFHNMSKLLTKTDLIIKSTGSGLILCLPKEEKWQIKPPEKIHKRERIEVRMPSGKVIQTFIKDIVMINRGRENGSIALLLPKSIKPEDVPEQSEIWLLRNDDKPVIEP